MQVLEDLPLVFEIIIFNSIFCDLGCEFHRTTYIQSGVMNKIYLLVYRMEFGVRAFISKRVDSTDVVSLGEKNEEPTK